jgi:hypothetical protein
MDNKNLLIFTVYIIIVSYVLYQAYKSLGNEVVVELDSADLNKQLEEQGLQDIIDIQFKGKKSYRLDELTKLRISIKNKSSKEDIIRVDWDQSAITDFDRITGRVIRLASGMTEVPQSQAVSIIVPGRFIVEELSDDKSLIGPLFKTQKLIKAIAKSDPFVLRLFLTITNAERGAITDRSLVPVHSDGILMGRPYTLYCRFIPKKLTLTKAIILGLRPKPSKKK